MTIYPLMFRLGPLTITGYGIMMMVAFLMAGWAIQVEVGRRGVNEDYAAETVFGAVVGGMGGARIWYVLLPGGWDALFRRGGFVWYGGFLGGVAAVLGLGWWRRVPGRWAMELTAAPLALGYALGRVGCFLVNDNYGIPSTLPWAMTFPAGLPPTTVGNLTQMHVRFPPGADPAQLVAVHPTQIYETVLMLLAFWWLWRLREHPPAGGLRFRRYPVFAGAGAVLVGGVRAKGDPRLGAVTGGAPHNGLLIGAGHWGGAGVGRAGSPAGGAAGAP